MQVGWVSLSDDWQLCICQTIWMRKRTCDPHYWSVTQLFDRSPTVSKSVQVLVGVQQTLRNAYEWME